MRVPCPQHPVPAAWPSQLGDALAGGWWDRGLFHSQAQHPRFVHIPSSLRARAQLFTDVWKEDGFSCGSLGMPS